MKDGICKNTNVNITKNREHKFTKQKYENKNVNDGI